MLERAQPLDEPVKYNASQLMDGLWSDEIALMRISHTLGSDSPFRDVVTKARFAANLMQFKLRGRGDVSPEEFKRLEARSEYTAASITRTTSRVL